jgi:hypothetical protein
MSAGKARRLGGEVYQRRRSQPNGAGGIGDVGKLNTPRGRATSEIESRAAGLPDYRDRRASQINATTSSTSNTIAA